MSWDTNIYYNPEKFGLTVVGEAEAGGGYEFDTFVVWRTEAGDYLWAEDAGCSCPTPFNDVHLGNAKRGTARDALTDLKAWTGPESDYFHEARTTAARSLVEKLEDAA